MTKSKIFFYFCVSFITGIFIGSIIKISLPVLLAFLITGLIIFSVFYKRKSAILGLSIIFICLGALRMEIAKDKIINNGFINLYGKNIVLEGVILKEPEIRERSVKLTVGEIKNISGRVLITLPRYPEYKYKDSIRISGKLEAPPVFEDFNYRDYLLKDGIYAVMSFPKTTLLKNDKDIYSAILGFKNKAREGIQKGFSPPYSSVLEGMILGDNAAMDNELKNKLNITGLRHIIAISGSHIVIISSILMSFLLVLGFWRGQAFYISIILISLFLIIAGLPASGIRAGIMGGILLLAQKTGRKNASSRTIVIACALMLAFNPLLLFYDVGFQLSFLASMGIIYLSPFINIPLIKGKEIKNALSMTFSAQIFTLPILVYNFGSVSLASFITNILIIPAVYFIMVFGFIFTLSSAISSLLAWIFSLPLWFLLSYFLKIMDWFSFPWAVKTIKDIHWFWIVIFYIILFFFVRYINEKERLKFLKY